MRERASHVQRLQKTLEDANIKLDGVVADLLGMSGRAMIEALMAGETDPAGWRRSPIRGSTRRRRGCGRRCAAG